MSSAKYESTVFLAIICTPCDFAQPYFQHYSFISISLSVQLYWWVYCIFALDHFVRCLWVPQTHQQLTITQLHTPIKQWHLLWLWKYDSIHSVVVPWTHKAGGSRSQTSLGLFLGGRGGTNHAWLSHMTWSLPFQINTSLSSRWTWLLLIKVTSYQTHLHSFIKCDVLFHLNTPNISLNIF